jgi:peptidoglycan-associated lipoprotein
MKRLLIVVAVLMLVFVVSEGCKKKEVITEPTPQPVVQKVEEPVTQVEKPVLTEEEIIEKASLEEINSKGYLKLVNFDYDKYAIKDEMKPLLQQNAEWLLRNSRIQIAVEGHCDERGTEEYNMALGEKRAKAAQAYLVSLGVPAERIVTISYGKSKLMIVGNSEEDHYQNRRAEFRVTAK